MPVVMAVTGLVRPPLQAWQAGVSLACFALEAFKMKFWTMLEDLADMPHSVQMMLVAAVLGVIVSAIAVLRPEPSA